MIIELEEVTKRYGTVTALNEASLGITEGSITGLIGPNGAGKTTSMEIISTLLARNGGKVTVAGHDPEQDPRAVRKVLGYMPDFFGVYDGLIVREYLDFFATAHGLRSEARSAVVTDLLALVDLDDKADVDVNSLSRGMKQRLSLARSLVHDPQVLVLDEPASGLDPRARVQLRELIGELGRMGKTVLISSHILSELEGICSHMAIVDRGSVKAQGTMQEIRAALVGNRRVTVRTPPDQLLTAEDVLRETEAGDELHVEHDHLWFTAAADDAALADLLKTLIDRDVSIWDWRVDSAGLEELFLRLTEEAET
jgi:ABC-2 type transport system ATP-binding protein